MTMSGYDIGRRYTSDADLRRIISRLWDRNRKHIIGHGAGPKEPEIFSVGR
jgi:hypothetical protein